MRPNARHLILDLLLATRGQALAAREAVAACALFGIRENNVRVALARLSAEGLLAAAGRGSYQLGPRAQELAGDVATWRTVEQRIRPWNGGYVVIHAGTLGRSDRTALRRRERALAMLGFRELERGLFIRPDNIEDTLTTLRQRLYTLGLEREAAVFLAQDFDASRDMAIRQLWDGQALTAAYHQERRQLEDWMQRAGALEPDAAARESFLLGSQAIRQVVFDPLLPEPFVDVQARHDFVDTVRRFDQLGHAIWQRLYESRRGESVTPRAAETH